jgi:hypothetical protein
MVDRATGHVPTLHNDPKELQEFLSWCWDMLLRLPATDPKYFQARLHLWA